MKKLLALSAASILVKFCSAFAILILSMIVTHSYDQNTTGAFFLSVTILTVLSAISRVGLDNTLLRNVSRLHGNNNKKETFTLFNNGITLFVCAYVALSLITIALSHSWTLTGKSLPLNNNQIYLILLAVFFTSLVSLSSNFLIGRRQSLLGSFYLSGLTPLAASILILALSETLTPFFIYLAASVITLTLALSSVYKEGYNGNFDPDKESLKSLARISRPFWTIILLQQAIVWSSHIIASFMLDLKEIALLSISQRVSMTISFTLIGVNFIMAPRFSHYAEARDTKNLQRLAQFSTRALIACTLPIYIAFMIFSTEILQLFGSEYTSARTTLIIFCTAQFVSTCCGSVGYLLMMTGLEKLQRNCLILGAGVTLASSPILIFYFGALGAAIASSAGIIIQNLSGIFLVKKHLGFLTFGN